MKIKFITAAPRHVAELGHSEWTSRRDRGNKSVRRASCNWLDPTEPDCCVENCGPGDSLRLVARQLWSLRLHHVDIMQQTRSLSPPPDICHFVKLCAACLEKRFHSKPAALRAAEKFVRRAQRTIVVSLRVGFFSIDVEEEKRRNEQKKMFLACDNHISHMFHSVDFRLLRLMFTVNSRWIKKKIFLCVVDFGRKIIYLPKLCYSIHFWSDFPRSQSPRSRVVRRLKLWLLSRVIEKYIRERKRIFHLSRLTSALSQPCSWSEKCWSYGFLMKIDYFVKTKDDVNEKLIVSCIQTRGAH